MLSLLAHLTHLLKRSWVWFPLRLYQKICRSKRFAGIIGLKGKVTLQNVASSWLCVSLSLVLALKPNNAQQINEKVSNTVKLNLDYLSKCTVKMMCEGSPGTMGQKVKRCKLTLLGCTGSCWPRSPRVLAPLNGQNMGRFYSQIVRSRNWAITTAFRVTFFLLPYYLNTLC